MSQQQVADIVKATVTQCDASRAPTADTTPQKNDDADTAWIDDDTTQETNDATHKSTNHTSTKAVAGNEEDGEGKGKKKRKKRANKRTVAALKEMRKDFMDRCVSPEFNRINRV